MRKWVPGRRAVDSQGGFERPASSLHATPLPIAPGVQAKLKIGEPNDRFEQEADRVAEAVLRAPTGDGSEPVLRRQHRRGAGLEPSSFVLRTGGVAEALGAGQPLAATERAFFEPRFGQYLSGVRIHTGARAAAACTALGAHAYTRGSDIVFGEGEFSPGTRAGRSLLAHELVHTLQQAADGQPDGRPRLQRSADGGQALVDTPFAGDPVLEAVSRGQLLLQIGARGEAVRRVQQVLIQAGFPLPGFGADGDFGFETRGVVRDFQSASGLGGRNVDGVVGPITLGLLAHAVPTNVIAQKDKGGCTDFDRPIDDAEPVFMCSASLASVFGLNVPIHHAFFRVGGEEASCGPTYSLFPKGSPGGSFPCPETLVQGRPFKNSSDVGKNVECTRTSVDWSCLESESSRYPWGFYCPLIGPNSNTFVGVLARACGDDASTPPGFSPGFGAHKPEKKTASPLLLAFSGLVCGADPFCEGPEGEGH